MEIAGCFIFVILMWLDLALPKGDVFGLYPAGVAPTRCNPADCPTRDLELPKPVPWSIVFDEEPLMLRALASIKGLRRWASAWVRLSLLLCPGILNSLFDYSSSWRRPSVQTMDFDATLGYPGEGPFFGFRLLQVLLLTIPLVAGSFPFPGFAL